VGPRGVRRLPRHVAVVANTECTQRSATATELHAGVLLHLATLKLRCATHAKFDTVSQLLPIVLPIFLTITDALSDCRHDGRRRSR